jgi:hypothetical protein
MYKTILSVAIVGLFSMTSYSNEVSELDSLMQDLSGGQNNSDVSLDDLDKLLDMSTTIDTSSKIEKIENITDVQEIDPSTEILNFTDNQSLFDAEFNTSGSSFDSNAIMDIIEEPLELDNSKFLKYIPEGTEIVFNKQVVVPRTKKVFIFSMGEPQIKVNKDSFSFCYVKFSQSNTTREIMKGRKFLINKNITKKAITSSDNKTVYFSTLYTDNQHLDYVKCLSNEQNKPLTVNDFESHFGGLINFVLPDYEKI